MFFQVTYNAIGTRGFPRATVRRPCAFEVVPEDAPVEEPEVCGTCGRQDASFLFHCEGPVDATIEGGSRWPDILGVDGVCPKFLVHERVVHALQRAGIGRFAAYAARIEEVRSTGLKGQTPPGYLYLNVPPGIDIDRIASGIEEAPRCPECNCVLPMPAGQFPKGPDRYVPMVSTWDGSDLFGIQNYRGSLVFCTEKVLQLAREQRWTNFRFMPMDMIQQVSFTWRGIDYLAKNWPPKSWYPSETG